MAYPGSHHSMMAIDARFAEDKGQLTDRAYLATNASTQNGGTGKARKSRRTNKYKHFHNPFYFNRLHCKMEKLVKSPLYIAGAFNAGNLEFISSIVEQSFDPMCLMELCGPGVLETRVGRHHLLRFYHVLLAAAPSFCYDITNQVVREKSSSSYSVKLPVHGVTIAKPADYMMADESYYYEGRGTDTPLELTIESWIGVHISPSSGKCDKVFLRWEVKRKAFLDRSHFVE